MNKKIFFTADWHVGHNNVILFDKRPFRDINHMHTVLVNNYNSSVGNNDVCYFLGDMGLCSGDTLKKVISRLNGTKVLILGNHDKNMFSMYNAGFDVVLNAGVFYLGTHRVSMSHCPLLGIPRENVKDMRGSVDGENWHGETRHDRFIIEGGDYHIHGHIHSTPDNKKEKSTDRQFDVGVAANNYRPVSWGEINAWIDVQEKLKEKI